MKVTTQSSILIKPGMHRRNLVNLANTELHDNSFIVSKLRRTEILRSLQAHYCNLLLPTRQKCIGMLKVTFSKAMP
jgi:hypothetical protein